MRDRRAWCSNWARCETTRRRRRRGLKHRGGQEGCGGHAGEIAHHMTLLYVVLPCVDGYAAHTFHTYIHPSIRTHRYRYVRIYIPICMYVDMPSLLPSSLCELPGHGRIFETTALQTRAAMPGGKRMVCEHRRAKRAASVTSCLSVGPSVSQ